MRHTVYNYFIGYRYSVTGAFGYEYYDKEGNKISASSLVMPFCAPVMIRGDGITMESVFDNNKDSLSIIQSDSEGANTRLFEITSCGMGEYEINGTIKVSCGTGMYTFRQNGRIAARINRANNNADSFDFVHLDDSYELCFEATVDIGLPPAVQAVILAFPMLRFEG